MNEKHDILMGREAQAVLDNNAFKQAMESLKASVTQNWKECPIRDREGALILLQLAKLTDKFESILVGMIESGKIAQHKIDINDVRDEPAMRRFMRKVSG